MKLSDYYRLQAHRLFDGEITASVFKPQARKPGRTEPVQQQIDFGAGPGKATESADDGARARQPH